MNQSISSHPSGSVQIDLGAISAWLADQRIDGAQSVENPRLLAGGSQNIVLRFSSGPRDFVLRHPPAKPRLNSNKLLEREIRMLRALENSAVPHPRILASCTDLAVTGAVFYMMEAVDGFNPTVEMSASAKADPAVRRRMGLEMIDALAALARLDHVAAGLADFGKLDGFLQRQVSRWASELESYAQFDGWEGPAALGDVAGIGRWLDQNCPQSMLAGVIHGDYHIGNGIFDDSGELRALIDWEMATLGDPLVDLGRILLSWPDGGARQPYTMRVDVLDGFPDRAEMVARYAEQSGRDLSSLPWFEVLSRYKLGLIFEGSHARGQAGLADRTTGERLHVSAIAMLEEARRIIARA